MSCICRVHSVSIGSGKRCQLCSAEDSWHSSQFENDLLKQMRITNKLLLSIAKRIAPESPYNEDNELAEISDMMDEQEKKEQS